MERFNKTILNEFFRIAFGENFYESVEAFRLNWISGLSTTILSVLIEATEIAENDPWIPCLEFALSISHDS